MVFLLSDTRSSMQVQAACGSVWVIGGTLVGGPHTGRGVWLARVEAV